MFTMLAKIAEILSALAERAFSGRRAANDAGVAEPLVGLIVELQGVIVRGRAVLRAATSIFDGTADQDDRANFRRLLALQSSALDEVRDGVVRLQPLLATFDSGLALQLLPFVDAKSGLIERWRQQAKQSSFSSTTVFFLSEPAVERIVQLGTAALDDTGVSERRAALVAVTGDEIALVRAGEARDIGNLAESAFRTEAAAAAVELDRASAACASIAASLQTHLGAEPMAALRRSLAKADD